MTNFTRQIVVSPEGGTASLVAAGLPTTGYFVGGIVTPLVIDSLDSVTVGQAVGILDRIDRFIEALHGKSIDFLGWWTNEEDGKLYVDGTSWHADEQEARRIGKSRGEIAIFDVERKTSIYLDPSHPVNRS